MKFNELLKLCSPKLAEEISNKKITFVLMRHNFKDDRANLKESKAKAFTDEEIDNENLIKNVLSRYDKLSAIRSDAKLAEIACSEQGKDKLGRINIVFGFAATSSTYAEFIGAFEVNSDSEFNQKEFLTRYDAYLSELPEKLREAWGFDKYVTKLGYSKQPRAENYYYDLELLKDPINQYKNRVIIDWGGSTVAWVQKSLEKEIVEIRAKGFIRDFTDYYDFVLPFPELKSIVDNPSGNPVWESKLSAVSGVYVILDVKTGQQYIGSAYGETKGFYGRWEAYARNFHGDNKDLKKLISENKNYESNFQISILRVMDKSSSKKNVIAAEAFLKQKLGTRVHGLNNN